MNEGAAPAWVMLAYLVAGMCFILALRGLSSPASSRRGNRFGMFGMALAVGTTLAVNFGNIPHEDTVAFIHNFSDPYWGAMGLILLAIALGAAIGLVTARRIAMTAMPQLVAAFHSLVGMAGVLVGPAIPTSE